jgi:hypothetical protein
VAAATWTSDPGSHDTRDGPGKSPGRPGVPPGYQPAIEAAVVEMARALLDATDRWQPEHLGRLEFVTGRLISIIERLTVQRQADNEWAGAAIRKILDQGYQVTTYREMDTGVYYVILTAAVGNAYTGATPDLAEAISHAAVLARIDL